MTRLARDHLPRGPVFWLGVRGFEERALASLEALLDAKVAISRVVDVSYNTHLWPQATAEARLDHVNRLLSRLLRGHRLASVRSSLPVAAYHPSSMFRLLSQLQDEAIKVRGATIVLDISCMTGAHVLSVGSWLTQLRSRAVPLFIAYSTPEQYRLPDWPVSSGWVETMLAPLSVSVNALMDSQQNSLKVPEVSNALVLLGHDGSRTEWALRQLAPEGGLFVLSRESRDSTADLAGAMSLGAHQKLLRRFADAEGWAATDVVKAEVAGARLRFEGYAALTAEQGRRLVILPFGPRIVTLTAALAALSVPGCDPWFCYPVPDRYFADSSVGVGRTDWFRLR